MGLQGKKCLFIVQGEGRGHMTQSVSMKQILQNAGIEVCEVIVGKSNAREIPAFYYEKMGVPITTIESPNMATGSNNREVKPMETVLRNTSMIPLFYRSVLRINRAVKRHKPDLIVNFFEPLCGMYNILFRPKIPIISVGHHYLYNHHEFVMPPGHFWARNGLKFYTWLTAWGSKKKLALSFYPVDDSTRNSIYVVPPLLREEVLLHPTESNDYLLVYLLNSGYIEDIIKWHNENPRTVLHCFVDKKGMAEVEEYDDTLFFHKLNDKKFLDLMAGAKGLVSTAGFESVCEAMYMGKPALMVPVEDHYEQFCNSRDAAKAGAGVYNKAFDIDKLLRYIPTHNGDNQDFKDWVKMAQFLILRQVHSVLSEGNNVRQMYPQMTLQKKIG